jgi:hypothetical protein
MNHLLTITIAIILATTPKPQPDFTIYPDAVHEREGYIREYLAYTYTPEYLANEEIENLIQIMKKESTYHDPKVISKNVLPSGERDGYGVSQILKSTWRLYGCEGNIDDLDVREQLDCTVKIYKRSGYYPWWNASKKLGLI